MPGPITHIAYAQHLLKTRRPELDAAVFIRGTIFPDIRFLNVIERDQTHQHGLSLEAVMQETRPWQAGMLFHSWLDDVWSEYFETVGLNLETVAGRRRLLAIKLLENHQLWRRVTGAADLAAQLVVVDEVAVAYGVAAADIERWGGLIGDTLAYEPTLERQADLLRIFGYKSENIVALMAETAKLQADDRWDEELVKSWHHIKARIDHEAT
jgi:hypothetical protein